MPPVRGLLFKLCNGFNSMNPEPRHIKYTIDIMLCSYHIVNLLIT